MFKKVITTIIAIAMMVTMSAAVFAEDIEVTIKDGVKITEGYADIPCIEINGQVFSVNNREMFYEYVGIGTNDRGLWEHGVMGNTVISRYTNPMYWHGSSALGSIDGLVRSQLVAAGNVAQATSRTLAADGNRAFWRVEQNM